ncbi:hypothetical protein PTKIN_Ptkin15bG0178200 [Pterospermum kingtungense]
MTGLVGVDARGRSGGLAMMWKEGVNLTLTSYSKYHIDTEIEDQDQRVWRLTGFYGDSDPRKRHEGWLMLRELSTINNKPWCCFGDFNEILWDSESKEVIYDLLGRSLTSGTP